MKILFLVDRMSGGGAERFTSLLSDKMVRDGHEVLLISDTYFQSVYPLNASIKSYPLFHTPKESGSLLCLFYMLRHVRKVLKAEKPAVVIGVMPVMNLVTIMASIGLGVKTIVTHHTSFDRRVGIHIRLIQNYVYRLASAVTILTQADEKLLGKRLPQKVVMPNPLSFPCITSEIKDRKKNILLVGRLDVWELKGFDLMIKMWARIEQQFPDWTLDIAGSGRTSSIQYLADYAASLGVSSRVNFLGFCDEIDAVMRNSSIFALTSRVEGFGMVLIEAMSQGCASIAFDCGGRQKEIICSDEEGLIVENHDEDAFISKLCLLMEDEELRSKISRNGIIRANSYHIDVIGKKWEELLSSL